MLGAFVTYGELSDVIGVVNELSEAEIGGGTGQGGGSWANEL